jgi:hypothetical protein
MPGDTGIGKGLAKEVHFSSREGLTNEADAAFCLTSSPVRQKNEIPLRTLRLVKSCFLFLAFCPIIVYI